MISAPCKDCKSKKIGCHSDCKLYCIYKQRLAEEAEARARYVTTRHGAHRSAQCFSHKVIVGRSR